jgi:tRNA(fMet)-specific endonuclease VapC
VLGELYFGAEKSGRVEANIKRIDEFVSDQFVLNCDRETARWYGRIEFRLRDKGRPIRQNDTWIAAIAMQYSLTVLTRDAHFDEVDGLALASW